jgi:amino acid transporter
MVAGGGAYFWTIAALSAELGHLAPPVLRTILVFTVVIVVLAIVGHILVAALSPQDADAASDERERKIAGKAAHLSGYVLGVGAIGALALYLITYDGNLMFYIVFASLILSQLAESVVRILLHRKGVY